jgi:hypothetical protein
MTRSAGDMSSQCVPIANRDKPWGIEMNTQTYAIVPPTHASPAPGDGVFLDVAVAGDEGHSMYSLKSSRGASKSSDIRTCPAHLPGVGRGRAAAGGRMEREMSSGTPMTNGKSLRLTAWRRKMVMAVDISIPMDLKTFAAFDLSAASVRTLMVVDGMPDPPMVKDVRTVLCFCVSLSII